MSNIVELRTLIKNTLNDNVVDPYDNGDSVRSGNHFFDESDGLNITRRKSFPKGFLKQAPGTAPVKQNQGRSGHITNYGTVDIFYLVGERQNYDNNGITYTNEDLVSFMLKQTQDTLLNNAVGSDYHLNPSSFGEGDIVKLNSPNGTFKLYQGVLPVTYYWDETYGI